MEQAPKLNNFGFAKLLFTELNVEKEHFYFEKKFRNTVIYGIFILFLIESVMKNRHLFHASLKATGSGSALILNETNVHN